MWKAGVLCALVACTFIQFSEGQDCSQFTLPKYYGSSMVFQKAPARPRVWGYTGNVGDVVIVAFDSLQTQSATAEMGPAGVPTWSVTFDPISQPGPFQVTIVQFATGCQFVLDDVLVGDVYVCSGQSNMQHSMNELDNPGPDIADVVNYPNVRTFFTSLQVSNVPIYDLIAVNQPWQRPTPASIGPFSALCWLFGRNLYQKLQHPIGLIESNWGGTRIEAWMSPDAIENCWPGGLPPTDNDPNGRSNLWNSMIHPFLPFPIYGAIWYQGESNTGNWGDYPCAIQSMVNDWRAKWNAQNPEMNDCFPFGEVQLAPWRNQDIVDGFPNIRWAQTYNHGYVPNDDLQCFFMAVAVDLPDYTSPSGDIHPRYKRQIADRLSLAAENVAYNRPDTGIFQGPIPVSHSVSAATVTLTYNVALEFRQTSGFYELCCSADPAGQCTPNSTGGSGGTWTLTTPSNTGTMTVELNNICTGTGNPNAVGFRYLWRESPCELEACPIYSVENSLPAPPFYLSFN